MRHAVALYLLVLSLVWGDVPPPSAAPSDSGRWAPLPEMQAARDGVVVAVVNGAAYVIGGSGNSSHLVMGGLTTVEKFDLLRLVWEYLPPMPTPRSGAAGVAIGDGIYVVGGLFFDLVIGAVEVYNTSINYWRQGAPMLTPRCCMAAVAVNGEVWVVGGGDTQARGPWVDIYNPGRDVWRRSTPLPDPRAYHAAAEYNGVLYVVGGQRKYDLPTMVLSLDTANPGKGWQAHPGDPSVQPFQGFGFAAVRNFLFLVGGLPHDSLEPTSQATVLNVADLTWHPVSPLSKARDCPGMAILAERLFIFGGFGPTHEAGTVLSLAESLSLVLPPPSPGPGFMGEGWGWHFLFWLAVLAAFYCVVGCGCNWRAGRAGLGLLPQLNFWCSELPALVLDGIVFSVTRLVALSRGLLRLWPSRTPHVVPVRLRPAAPEDTEDVPPPPHAFTGSDWINYR
eukprot:EG_transcript_12819